MATDQSVVEDRAVSNTMTLNLPDKEWDALERLAVTKDMSKTSIMRQALRFYELVEHRLAGGERMFFSGDDQRMTEFIGLL